jgi:membrane protease YdiL (CAAX protease family)
MPLPAAQQEIPGPAAAAILAVFVFLALACLGVGLAAAVRFRRGMPVVPYEHRRPVPWGAGEVTLILLLYLFLPALVLGPSAALLGIPFPLRAPAEAEHGAQAGAETAVETDAGQADEEEPHLIARLIFETDEPWFLILALVSAALVAPVVEEFLFRVVLQGWLESAERRIRRRVAAARTLLPGVAPVAASSIFFAALHAGRPAVGLSVEQIAFLLGIRSAVNVAVLGVGLVLLRVGSRATWADLGLVREKLPGDTALGLAAWLGVTAPVYLLLVLAKAVLPPGAVADPIALLPLALLFGWLYYRTHRAAPVVVLHVAFNATAIALALLGRAGGM